MTKFIKTVGELSGLYHMVNLYKPIGPTTFRLIEKFRQVFPDYQGAVLGFAGRLDPIAEGVVLILVGEENKQRDKYLPLDKEYIFEILFGFATDTFDTLGLITDMGELPEDWQKKLQKLIPKYQGEILQKFPPYSSKHIKGKALFEWAAEGRLNEIEIPKVKRTIYDIQLLDIYQISEKGLKNRILENISKVEGLFRQEKITEQWRKILNNNSRSRNIAKIKISASSGTYVRGIADDISKNLGSFAVALSIKRTRVGEYKIEDSIKII